MTYGHLKLKQYLQLDDVQIETPKKIIIITKG